MARMNVKIATEKIISALETKLSQLQKDKADEQKNKQAYDKAVKDWEAKVIKLTPAKAVNISVSDNARYGGKDTPARVTYVYEVPADKLPARPVQPETISDWSFREMVDEISNAVRILKLTDQTEVSTSTYNSVAKYL